MLPSEYFTYQFYTWESRGRGWFCYNEPVCLEPPFIPFRRVQPQSGHIDESKRPTWISSLIDSIKGKKHSMREEKEILDYETIEPFEYTGTMDLSCHVVRVPKARKTNPEQMGSFLIMLSQTKYNVSFELFGNATEIIIQLITSAEESSIVKTFLASFFPEYTIQNHNQYLEILPPDKQTHTVDFGLREECVRPLAIVKNFTIDPLTAIIGILDALQNDEFAGIQILFQGTVNNWRDSMMRSVSINGGKSFFADMPDAPKITQEKVSSPLFGVSIRAFSQEQDNKNHIIQSLCHAVIQATKGSYNELMPMYADVYSDQDRISDIYLRESHRLGMLLSSDELITLLHFPSESIQSKKLFKSTRKTTPVPSIAQNKKMILGSNTHENETTPVTYGIDDRLKHTHIIGATGTGKSTLLAHMILQDINNGFGISLFDPHGDLIDDVIARMPKEAIERVVLIDPADSEFPIGLNILQAHSDLEKEVLSSDLVASFRRLSTSWGDQMNTVFANAILAILENSEGGTLSDLRRFLIEASYRNSYLKKVSDPSIRYYWQKEYPLLKTNSIGPILTRLDSFLRTRIIRNMVSQKQGLNFENILAESKILLIKLPQGLIGKENSFLLGSLILSKLHQASFGRQASHNRPPFFIYLDEFHNFITPSIKEMLSGVRKYSVGLILSHQDLQQIQREDAELLNSVLGNIYTRIVFRVGEPDARKLQDGFTDFDYTEMQNLGVGEALIRIEQPRYNTTFDTEPLKPVDLQTRRENLQLTQEYSRRNYSQPKEKIEKELLESYGQENNIEAVKENHLVIEAVTDKKTQEPIKDDITEKPIAISKTSSKEKKTSTLKEEENLSTHKYLQNLIKKFAEAQEFTVTLEASLPTGDGNVDVAIYKNEKRIAIEICVTTDSLWEVHNIKKCIDTSAFETVISVCGDAKQLEKIKRKYTELYGENNTILYYTPDALFEFLQKNNIQEPEIKNTETNMKGYRINVNYDSISQTEMSQKKSAIANVIFNSMKKRK